MKIQIHTFKYFHIQIICTYKYKIGWAAAAILCLYKYIGNRLKHVHPLFKMSRSYKSDLKMGSLMYLQSEHWVVEVGG